MKVYLVGGGITSLAAAAFLIRDADVPGHNITILEELDRLGGSLDGTGSPTKDTSSAAAACSRASICAPMICSRRFPPSIESKTVTKEIFDWNETTKTSSQSRLVRDGLRERCSRIRTQRKPYPHARAPDGGTGRNARQEQHRRPV